MSYDLYRKTGKQDLLATSADTTQVNKCRDTIAENSDRSDRSVSDLPPLASFVVRAATGTIHEILVRFGPVAGWTYANSTLYYGRHYVSFKEPRRLIKLPSFLP